MNIFCNMAGSLFGLTGDQIADELEKIVMIENQA